MKILITFRFKRMEQVRDERIGYIRDILMKFVNRLITVIDKIEGTRYLTTFLNVIYKCTLFIFLILVP